MSYAGDHGRWRSPSMPFAPLFRAGSVLRDSLECGFALLPHLSVRWLRCSALRCSSLAHSARAERSDERRSGRTDGVLEHSPGGRRATRLESAHCCNRSALSQRARGTDAPADAPSPCCLCLHSARSICVRG